MDESYSINMLLCAAFHHELKSNLETLPVESMDEEIVTVMEYMKKRIIEIDNKYKGK